MKKKLNAYQGTLNAAQIAEGMNVATENAKRLAVDATLLLEAGRYPTAASVAILSIEEAGKLSILRTLSLAKSSEEASKVWKEYRSHIRKNVAWLLPQLVAGGASKLDDLRPLFDADAEHPYILDQLKQIGFYSDCLGNAHWSRPESVVDESLAKTLVQIANLFGKDRQYTVKEIELWIKHLGPVSNRDPGWMKQALVNWYADMQNEGLAPEGGNAMEELIREGIKKW